MVRARGVARKSFARRRVRRVKKYDHHVLPLRFKLQLPDMADRLKPKLDVHVLCETPTMELLETLGVPLAEYPYYLGFMKRMVVIYQTFTADTLVKERDALIAEYVLRGKSEDVLEQIEEVAALCAEAEFEMDLWTRDFYKLFQFQDIAGASASGVGGNGSASISGGSILLSTGNISPGNVYVVFGENGYNPNTGTPVLTWDKNRKLRVGVVFDYDVDQIIYLGVGNEPPTSNFIGFKVVNNELFGVVSDGVTETLTAVIQTITAGESYILEARFTAGVECKFYVNGEERATLTSGLPTGETYGFWILFAEIYNTIAEDRTILVGSWEFYQKR
jgi:hypothetical protein